MNAEVSLIIEYIHIGRTISEVSESIFAYGKRDQMRLDEIHPKELYRYLRPTNTEIALSFLFQFL